MKLVNLVFLYLCFTLITIVLGFGDSEKSDCNKNKRLIDYFLIGEKAVKNGADDTDEKSVSKGVDSQNITPIPNFGEINAFSIIDVKLDTTTDVISSLNKRAYNILLVAELKKKGEETWHRISVINRYSREIQKSSQARRDKEDKKAEESTKDTPSLKPYYVADVILSDNQFIRQGDRVQALFFHDVTKYQRFTRDLLEDAQEQARSLMSIDAQKMYLMQIGSTPQEYAAKHGDKIRLRFLRAEYSIYQWYDIEYGEQGEEANAVRKKYADLISVEDKMNFVFKEFGIKLDVSPTIVYGSRFEGDSDMGEFNPIDKNPSFGSNIFLSYDGRNPNKKRINLLPGLHLSLLGLNTTNEVKFTGGIVWSLPSLRKWIGIFVGLYDLRQWVFGLTFSPSIDFRTLVQAEKKSEKSSKD